jgi:hypothetical protein
MFTTSQRAFLLRIVTTKMTVKSTVFWALAQSLYGGIVPAALVAKCSPNTLRAAAAGLPVRPETRAKIEALFNLSLEHLRLPLAELPLAAVAANRKTKPRRATPR